MQRVNAFLRSEAATLGLLLIALTAQAPHAATVFHRVAPNGAPILSWVHAAGYAVALEMTTLMFVVRGQRRLAWTFAAVSVAVNLLYYWTPGMTATHAMSALLISVALPLAIAMYSHDVARQAHAQESRQVAKEPVLPDVAPLMPDVAPAEVDVSDTEDVAPPSTQQQRALAMLAEGFSMVNVAQELGVNRSTVHRWRKAQNGAGIHA